MLAMPCQSIKLQLRILRSASKGKTMDPQKTGTRKTSKIEFIYRWGFLSSIDQNNFSKLSLSYRMPLWYYKEVPLPRTLIYAYISKHNQIWACSSIRRRSKYEQAICHELGQVIHWSSPSTCNIGITAAWVNLVYGFAALLRKQGLYLISSY